MTLEEIVSLVAQRLLQGSMNHQQFCDYYSFLGLEGYKFFHEYHFLEQTINYKDFTNYYMQHYDRLVSKFSIDSLTSISIVPDNWYNYTRQDVDLNTKRNAIKNGLQKYSNWEKETKKFLEDMYVEANNIHEIGIAIQIKKCIIEVDKEIKKAEKCLLEIKSTDFDLPTVISKQDFLIKKYKKKIKQLRKEFEHVKSQRD